MLNLLGAISTETIIGIVAIIIIVISVAIIVAVAVRNYLLHKKFMAENAVEEENMQDAPVQEIDQNNAVGEESDDATTAIVTDKEIEDASQCADIKEEFADEDSTIEEPVQEIDTEKNNFADEQDKIYADDIQNAELTEDEIAEVKD